MDKRKLFESLILLFALLLILLAFFSQLEIHWGLRIGLSVCFTLGIIAFVYYNKTFRCVICISVLRLSGPQVRILLLSTVSGLLIAGPILSITRNLNEVQATTECVNNLVKEHTEELKESYSAAYKDISYRVERSIENWKNIGEQIEDIIGPVRKAFSIAAQTIQEIYGKIKHVSDNCEKNINGVKQKCISGTSQVYSDCVSKVPSLRPIINEGTNFVIDTSKGAEKVVKKTGDKIKEGIKKLIGRKRRSTPDLKSVCEVLKIGDQSCNIFHTNVCIPLKVTNIASPLPDLTNSLGQLVDLLSFSVDTESKIGQNASSSVGNITEEILILRKDITETFETVSLILKSIQIILSCISLLLVPIFAYIYLCKVRKVLKVKKEKDLDKFFRKDAKKERQSAFSHFLLLITHALLSFAIFSFDIMLYQTQNVVEKHGGANFTATGAVEVNLNVMSGPILEPFLDILIQDLSIEQNYDFEISSDKCLPKPVPHADMSTVYFVGGMYLFCMVSLALQGLIGPMKKRVVLYFINQD